MKTRLEQLVIADYELRKGTVDEIKARVIDLLLHGFHSVVSDYYSAPPSMSPVAAY